MSCRLLRIRLAGMAVVAAIACNRPLQVDYYDFDFQKPMSYEQLVVRSSVIVAGTVQSVRIIREAVPARRQPELRLDETRVAVKVENILRGDVRGPRLEFVFFGYSLRNPGGYDGP